MSKVSTGSRYLLGLVYFVFGLNFFLNFIPPPPEMPENMKAVMSGFMATGYLFPFIKITEIVCGALLLGGFFAPLSLIILAPITLNILGIHVFVAPSGLPMAAVMVVLHVLAARNYKETFAPLLRAK